MAIDWPAIEKQFTADVADHWVRAQSIGLECPFDVFEQLFFDHHADHYLIDVVRSVDWGNVEWADTELSGTVLRRVAVPRLYQHAVDEARWRTREEGVQDVRPAVMDHWRTAGTWIRAPILVAGEVIGSSLGNECLVGFSRLGNLLGLIDRQEVPEAAHHRVWLGRSTAKPVPVGTENLGKI
jgi:hypothetical protein